MAGPRLLPRSIDVHNAQPVGADAATSHFVVAAQVDEGLQHHLGDLRFEKANGGTPIFSDEQLRSTFPIHEGEIFDVSKVRAGLDAVKKLYDTEGYIDFTTEPDTEIDENLQRVSIVVKLDEEKQYSIGKLDFLGHSPSLEAELRAILPTGAIFSGEALQHFYDQNGSVLPWHFQEGVNFVRDEETGTVDLVFDFRACPSH